MSRHTQALPRAVQALILLQFLLGLGALLGGGSFILAPDGRLIHMPLSVLKSSPFTDFRIPGILLFTFVGVYPIAVAYGLWKQPTWRWPNGLNPFKRMHWSWAGSLAAGAIILIWIIVQVQMIQAISFLHVLYLVWGGLIVLLTLLPAVQQHYRLSA